MYQKIPYLHGSKNKGKILPSLEEEQNVKWQELRDATHEALNGFLISSVKTFPYRTQ